MAAGVPATFQGVGPNGPWWKRSGNAGAAMSRCRPLRRLANAIRAAGLEPIPWQRVSTPRLLERLRVCGGSNLRAVAPDAATLSRIGVSSRLSAWCGFERSFSSGIARSAGQPLARMLRHYESEPEADARLVIDEVKSRVRLTPPDEPRCRLVDPSLFRRDFRFQPLDPGRAAHPGIGEKTKVLTTQGAYRSTAGL